MRDQFTADFFAWADRKKLRTSDIAKALFKKPKTITNWKTNGVPERQIDLCRAFMTGAHKADPVEEIRAQLVMRPTHGQFTNWNRAALNAGKTIEEWATEGLDKKARAHFQLRAAEERSPYNSKNQPRSES